MLSVVLSLIMLLVPRQGAVAARTDQAAPSDQTSSVDPELADLEKATSRIRGLEFKTKVDYQVVARPELQDLLSARLNEEFPPGKLEKLSIAYAKLGLIKPEVNLKDAILSLYSEQLVAFYDHHKKKLYSVKGFPFSPQLQKVIMVHELTHALQDHNFDLSSLPLECENDDDRALAALSLVEGDAILVFSKYAAEGVDLGLKDVLTTMSMGQKGLLEAPYVVRRNLLFPYTEGAAFVTRLFRQGGWELVNRTFKDPPLSTEQIIHPEKYLQKRDDPVPIVLPDFSSLAGKKWELLEDNVLGELNSRVLFSEFIGSLRSIRPSKGWGGDRFRVYRGENRDETILIWATAWDTQKDAEEFVSSYRTAIARKYPRKEFITVEAEDCVSFSSEGLVVWLGWTDTKALVLEAPDSFTLLAMLWELLRAAGGPSFTETKSLVDSKKR